MAQLSEADPTVFDARPYQRRQEEPYAYIMKAVEALRPDQDLLLINTFDPRPLEAVMAARGYSYAARQIGPEHWEVRFTRNRPPDEPPLLDNRGVTPAQASVRTLQTLRRIGDQPLTVLFDSDPAGLGAELDRRGYRTTIARDAGETYRMTVTSPRPRGLG